MYMWVIASVQVEICKKVIRFYQEIAQAWILDHTSWLAPHTLLIPPSPSLSLCLL